MEGHALTTEGANAIENRHILDLSQIHGALVAVRHFARHMKVYRHELEHVVITPMRKETLLLINKHQTEPCTLRWIPAMHCRVCEFLQNTCDSIRGFLKNTVIAIVSDVFLVDSSSNLRVELLDSLVNSYHEAHFFLRQCLACVQWEMVTFDSMIERSVEIYKEVLRGLQGSHAPRCCNYRCATFLSLRGAFAAPLLLCGQDLTNDPTEEGVLAVEYFLPSKGFLLWKTKIPEAENSTYASAAETKCLLQRQRHLEVLHVNGCIGI
eukprot:2939586-Rhodomonas_salina.1